MFNTIWAYILRLALALYFLFDHVPALIKGVNKLSLSDTLFTCFSQYLPAQLVFNLWHGLFILLALFILFWPRPIFIFVISLLILLINLYFNFSLDNYSLFSLLIVITILINISLLIIYSRRLL
jgi:hypothetical protein